MLADPTTPEIVARVILRPVGWEACDNEIAIARAFLSQYIPISTVPAVSLNAQDILDIVSTMLVVSEDQRVFVATEVSRIVEKHLRTYHKAAIDAYKVSVHNAIRRFQRTDEVCDADAFVTAIEDLAQAARALGSGLRDDLIGSLSSVIDGQEMRLTVAGEIVDQAVLGQAANPVTAGSQIDTVMLAGRWIAAKRELHPPGTFTAAWAGVSASLSERRPLIERRLQVFLKTTASTLKVDYLARSMPGKFLGDTVVSQYNLEAKRRFAADYALIRQSVETSRRLSPLLGTLNEENFEAQVAFSVKPELRDALSDVPLALGVIASGAIDTDAETQTLHVQAVSLWRAAVDSYLRTVETAEAKRGATTETERGRLVTQCTTAFLAAHRAALSLVERIVTSATAEYGAVLDDLRGEIIELEAQTRRWQELRSLPWARVAGI